jgi:hypothetical protein
VPRRCSPCAHVFCHAKGGCRSSAWEAGNLARGKGRGGGGVRSCGIFARSLEERPHRRACGAAPPPHPTPPPPSFRTREQALLSAPTPSSIALLFPCWVRASSGALGSRLAGWSGARRSPHWQAPAGPTLVGAARPGGTRRAERPALPHPRRAAPWRWRASRTERLCVAGDSDVVAATQHPGDAAWA